MSRGPIGFVQLLGTTITVMAKIFYCEGQTGRVGVLRAVIPFSDLKPLVSSESPDYVGQSFPAANRKSSAHIVFEIVSDEEDVGWRVGFYYVDKGPLQFEDTLRAFCKAAGLSV